MNQGVMGSNPAGRARNIKGLHSLQAHFIWRLFEQKASSGLRCFVVACTVARSRVPRRWPPPWMSTATACTTAHCGHLQ